MIAKNKEGEVDVVEFIREYISNFDDDNFILASTRVEWKRTGEFRTKKLKFLDHPISYNAALGQFREALDEIGMEGKQFGLHSMRTGAVSEAANSGNCDLKDIRRHGRWKSGTMPSYYRKLDLKNKLKASEALKINRF